MLGESLFLKCLKGVKGMHLLSIFSDIFFTSLLQGFCLHFFAHIVKYASITLFLKRVIRLKLSKSVFDI